MEMDPPSPAPFLTVKASHSCSFRRKRDHLLSSPIAGGTKDLDSSSGSSRN